MDTRSTHEQLFSSLVPLGHKYFAGHYRGEPFKCLRYYRVEIQGDPRVGYPPEYINSHMSILGDSACKAVATLEASQDIPEAQLGGKNSRLYHAVIVACAIFELFLRIHPYANGNGHLARVCVLAVLSRMGCWPKGWTVEPRPPDPPYTQLLVDYRNGNKEPLERYILQCVLNKTP